MVESLTMQDIWRNDLGNVQKDVVPSQALEPVTGRRVVANAETQEAEDLQVIVERLLRQSIAEPEKTKEVTFTSGIDQNITQTVVVYANQTPGGQSITDSAYIRLEITVGDEKRGFNINMREGSNGHGLTADGFPWEKRGNFVSSGTLTGSSENVVNERFYTDTAEEKVLQGLANVFNRPVTNVKIVDDYSNVPALQAVIQKGYSEREYKVFTKVFNPQNTELSEPQQK